MKMEMSALNGLGTTSIESLMGNHYTLAGKVSQGTQGIVYNEVNGEHLIKLFFEHNAENIQILEKKLRALYTVSLPPRFIKPLDIVRFERNGKLYVGYVMKRIKGYSPLNKLLIPSSEMTFGKWYNDFSGGLKRRLYLGYQIAQSFDLLHRSNLAYYDISGDNILVAKNPNINSVCMIDIDNVYTPGVLNSNTFSTMRYIAPEVITQQMRPDIITDDYALAVILFELLRCGHPYIGDFIKAGSPELELAAFRGEFPFADDEDDTFNASSDMLPSGIVLNQKLHGLFKRTFANGRKTRMFRATSKELSVACLEASNVLIHCHHCGAWYFPFPKLRTEDFSYYCPWCSEYGGKNVNTVTALIQFGKYYPHIAGVSDKKKPNLEKTFLLENGVNIITRNYTCRQLTDNDIVQTGTTMEVEGNIRSAFFIYYDIKKLSCEIENRSGKTIFLQRGSLSQQPVKDNQCIALKDEDRLYFEYPHQETSYNEIISGEPSARTYQMAHINLF
jgi:serine/threonine protein kinase